MNYRLLCRLLGIICLLLGGTMIFSLPFANQFLSQRSLPIDPIPVDQVASAERHGVFGLSASMLICAACGIVLMLIGRGTRGNTLYRKEAMAVVGLSWILATVLGALPYYLGGVEIVDGQPITFVEAMFEAQSGFSTTGATVLTNLHDPRMVPCCLLFWRSWTHFLGGLGIIVLFVAVLGQGSAGKAMMRAEMPGPTKEGSMPRMQQTALNFAGLYIGCNILLTIVYYLENMTLFDSLCHAFGTMATGGFSTYNGSLGEFDSATIEYTTILFMILAGTNFTLLYLTLIGDWKKILRDVEFRTYVGIITLVTAGIVFFGMQYSDHQFDDFASSLRFGLFTVVSVLTTTGYGTADFDQWNNFGRGVLLLIMFVGGCAGSTGGGMKVIRHVLLYKILRLEIEKAHHPRVVRPLRVSGVTVEDADLAKNILVYFCLILAIFAFSWLAIVTWEPDSTWGPTTSSTLDEKLLDSASIVAATLNNIGPGLGVVGATKNYSGFSQGSKFLFVWLMMLGRVEVFSVLVLISPRFWRSGG